ncbi:ExbD/TolR family protein [Rhodovulum adriaticum]|uniref:Biopolymer transport protein ExbD n=1 Tax=Rhodovulum adriaticum TaxID=35804 RepID=A0A4R2NKK0_RHOAD|nr:biopolymer transporter ExbD [Rhodovulum adriaticum]MBK1637051.1 indolepyruvate ferredoxin oxidoreductase [Rhodovulum adriaticum]TCP21991.1 biopolymer transport protein ExbD [Rhodovulum adriaticum]
MSLNLCPPAPRRKPSLTPMIDVVFLLLVFFMLASRFGQDVTLPVAGGGGAGADWSGPPRLVDIRPGVVALNGVQTALPDLPAALEPLTDSPADPVVLRPRDGADLQRVITVMEALSQAGHDRLILVE